MAKIVRALNSTPYHPESPLPEAKCFLFEGMGLYTKGPVLPF